MTGVDGWTLAELAELAARALAQTGVRVASGRVTDVPDARLIRWYATIGLLDRPTIGPGRVARYGRRHLLQLVAVKRLQAQGLSLAQIQHRLAGATDAQLRSVAQLPADLAEASHPARPGATDRSGAPAHPGSADRPDATNRPVAARSTAGGGEPTRTGGRFWTTRPAVDTGRDTVARVYGVRVGGLTLLLPEEPAPHDLAEIAAAARPLLDLLAARGWLRRGGALLDSLLDPTEGAGDDPTGAHR